jgi:AraC-like DNA-binding protein
MSRMAVKAQIEKLLPPPTESFLYKVRREPRFGTYWHFHPEYQLTLIVRGRGRRFVGDHVGRFGPGDLVLTGPNLPHMWCSGRARIPGNKQPDEAFMIQFPEGMMGGSLLRLPEMAPVRRLLEASRRGVRFEGAARKTGAKAMARMRSLRGPARVIALLEILCLLAEARRPEILSSSATAPTDRGDRERIDRICRFIAERASGPLLLAEAAAASHMSVPAFTRFFRKSTKKTFVEYLTELRVGKACHLLLESDATIRQISSAAGFHSLSNFNRRFRKQKGMSPKSFRDQFCP